MTWRSDSFAFLRRVFQFRSMRPDLDSEIDAEIDYHLQRTRDDLERKGLPPEAARREATRRFGDLRRHRRRMLESDRRRGRKDRMIAMIEAVHSTARDALRSLRASPGVTLTVILTIALGIGANATMFGIVDRLLLSAPPHVQEADRLAQVHVERTFIDRKVVSGSLAYPDYRDWLRAGSFSDVAAISNVWGSGNTTVGHGEDASKIVTLKATANFFPLLGVRPALGRFYSPDEDVAGRARIAVLGHAFWRSRFGGDPEVLGEEIVLDGAPHEIIGVAPEGFTGVDVERIDAFTPLRSPTLGMDPEQWESSRGYYWLRAIARLAPGVEPQEAAAEATALHRAGREDDERYDPEARVLLGSIIPGRALNASAESEVAAWLAAVSAIVLLIACANVANILLARGTRRGREIGVRLALGVSARRLFSQLLLESVLLALAGGAAALALAHWGGRIVRATLLPDVHWAGSPVDPRVLVFTFAAALLTGVLAGLAPALAAARRDVVAVLGGGGERGGGVPGARLRAGMLLVQTTLSVVLLIGAGLFVKSLGHVNAIDLGFEPDGLLVVTPEVDSERLAMDRDELLAAAAERLRAVPAIDSVTTAASVPFYSSTSTTFVAPDVPERPVFSTGGPYILAVDPHYFETMRVRIVEGRGFTEHDDEGAPLVAVLEQTMAEAYWPDERAIGKCVRIGDTEAPCTTVVGIAEPAARQSLRPQREAQYYVPLAQRSAPYALFARIVPERASELAHTVRREVEAVDPAIRFANVQPLRSLIDPQARSWELGATMFSAFGGLALLIAAIGLYGVLSFSVAQRRHEIGVRSALGADPRRLVALIVRQALVVVAGSIVAGSLIALLTGRFIAPMLYDVRPTDPGVLVAVGAILIVVGVISSALPASRATSVEPVIALRTD